MGFEAGLGQSLFRIRVARKSVDEQGTRLVHRRRVLVSECVAYM